MKLFRCCCSCFAKQDNVIRSPVQVSSEIREPESVAQQQPPPPKIIIETKFRLEDVKLSEFTPVNTQKPSFAYNCPICLRYFSTILVIKCCKQYICHYCIEELNKEVKFEIACPHCKAVPIIANDVELGSTIKMYSDSQYVTFMQRTNNVGNQWVPMKVVQESNEYEESQHIPESLNLSLQPVQAVSLTKMHMTA